MTKIKYVLIRYFYKSILIRLMSEDVMIYLLANSQIKDISENEKVYDGVRDVQIYHTMRKTDENYNSSADFVDFFIKVKMKSQKIVFFPQSIIDCFHPRNILKYKYRKRLIQYYHSQYLKVKDNPS